LHLDSLPESVRSQLDLGCDILCVVNHAVVVDVVALEDGVDHEGEVRFGVVRGILVVVIFVIITI
jgi:hypothetical protein